MKKIFISIIIVLSFNSILNSQWTPTNDPIGGQINALTISENTIFAGSAFGGGCFRSNDNGIKWVQCNNGLLHGYINAFESSDSLLFACTQQGVFVSGNNGDNWVESNRGLTKLNARSISLNGKNLFLATIGGGGSFSPTIME